MGIFNTLNFITRHPLNESQKITAIRRWAAWQVGSRLVPGPVVVNFVNNTMLLVSPGMTGATGNIYAGLHEFQDMAFVLHLLRQGDVFIDVGANVGVYTVLAGGLGARCISIEPIKSAFDHLMLNLSLNGFRELVDARNIGLGSVRGRLKFTNELDTVNHVAVELDAGNTGLCEVEVDTLDNVVSTARPILIKIDVEGFETEVIAGGGSVLSEESLLAVIMELNGSGRRYKYNESALYERMIDYGFRPCAYAPLERSLNVLDGKNISSGNTVFVKDVKAVRERINAAPAFNVNGRSI